MSKKPANLDQSVSIESLAAIHTTEEPQVNEEIVSQLLKKESDNAGTETVESGTGSSLGVDSAGVSFDPQKHETNPDGTPRKTKTGKYRWKHGARAGSPVASAPTPGAGPGLTPDRARAEALLISTLMFGVATGCMGADWEPTKTEKQNVEDSLATYFLAVGTIDLPPWLGPVITIGAYALPRYNKAQNAHVNSGHDGKR